MYKFFLIFLMSLSAITAEVKSFHIIYGDSLDYLCYDADTIEVLNEIPEGIEPYLILEATNNPNVLIKLGEKKEKDTVMSFLPVIVAKKEARDVIVYDIESNRVLKTKKVDFTESKQKSDLLVCLSITLIAICFSLVRIFARVRTAKIFMSVTTSVFLEECLLLLMKLKKIPFISPETNIGKLLIFNSLVLFFFTILLSKKMKGIFFETMGLSSALNGLVVARVFLFGLFLYIFQVFVYYTNGIAWQMNYLLLVAVGFSIITILLKKVGDL